MARPKNVGCGSRWKPARHTTRRECMSGSECVRGKVETVRAPSQTPSCLQHPGEKLPQVPSRFLTALQAPFQAGNMLRQGPPQLLMSSATPMRKMPVWSVRSITMPLKLSPKEVTLSCAWSTKN